MRNGVVKIDVKDKPLWVRELIDVFDKKNMKRNDKGIGFNY